MKKSVFENPAPLQNNYLPENFEDREEEAAALKAVFSDLAETSSRNIHLYGPRGTGKTHLTHHILEELPDKVNTCYVPCTKYDTEYKALKQVYKAVAQQEVNNGYHTSELQRKIEERTGALPTIIVLDEIDFALLNNGDSLLYFLSRMQSSENTSIITISPKQQELDTEERTQSSLQPQRIKFPAYTGEQIYEILLQRAKQALQQRTLHEEALTYIASTTSNAAYALTWLRTAAETTDQVINEKHVQNTANTAHRNYVDRLLEHFSEHHQLIYQAIEELTQEKDRTEIRSGSIYNRYQELCQTYNENTLSNRRISDYLKHLELLNLIKAEYHYGGNKGKTREIKLRS
jgi:orc1/cdc6 family replication initiation protein